MLNGKCLIRPTITKTIPMLHIHGDRQGCQSWGVGGERRRPRGTGGGPPKNLRWGTAHALVPPIFREVVLSDTRESINRVKKGVFLVRKGSNMTFNTAQIGKIWEKQGKILKRWSMTKITRNFCRENGNFFPPKVIQKSWLRRKNFPCPQTRRQVSATVGGSRPPGFWAGGRGDRNFSKNCLENRFFTRIHDPQISNQIDAAGDRVVEVTIQRGLSIQSLNAVG